MKRAYTMDFLEEKKAKEAHSEAAEEIEPPTWGADVVVSSICIFLSRTFF
jgi:hypothetical protein